MKVAFFNLEGWEPAVYQEAFRGHDVQVLDHPYTQEGLTVDKAAAVAGAEILSISAMSLVNEAVLAALPHLKLIATRCTGFDHIDVAAARARGIAVSNVPVYGENTVAEFTFALILTLARRLTTMFARSKQGRLTREDLRGMDLAGSTLGVVGAGRIGAHVVRIAGGFDMRIICYDTYQKQELVEAYGVIYLPLEELLRRADIITIHLPYLPETHHLINRDNIALLKKGALLVNAARGDPSPTPRPSSGPWRTASWGAWRWTPLKGSCCGSRKRNWCTAGRNLRRRIIGWPSKVFIWSGSPTSFSLRTTPSTPPRRCAASSIPIWRPSSVSAKPGK